METDYSKIAFKYDNNPIREKTVDPIILDLILKKSSLRILDLACGTGSYLKTQIEFYKNNCIEWMGLDKSKDMLEIAGKKNPMIEFIYSSIEECDKTVGKFDYIHNEFAFHHFIDKEKAVKNVYSFLEENGVFFIRNICPDYMKKYWIYTYFPNTKQLDNERFLDSAALYKLLIKNGFIVEMKSTTEIHEINYKNILSEAENRDASQLNIISTDEYEDGIERIKFDMNRNTKRVVEFSIITVKAVKKM